MLISIVTPSYRRPKFLEQTIDSIMMQQGDFDLEYIVQDGGGSDATANLLERKLLQFKLERRLARKTFKYFIEPDDGMYSAINRGFSRTSGDIMAWLNSDDMYHPFALNTVHQIFEQFPEVAWITGIPNSYNIHGARTGFDSFPTSYSREFIRRGYYDVKHIQGGFNWIQQESTFWRRELWNARGPLREDRKLASDFFLWQSFAEEADLVKAYTFLGGFRVHDDQFTSDASRYRDELENVELPSRYVDFYNSFNRDSIFRSNLIHGDPEATVNLMRDYQLSRSDLVGSTIRWDFNKQEWTLRQELLNA